MIKEIALLAFALTPFASLAQTPTDLETVLEQHYEAIGGIEHWQHARSLECRGTAVLEPSAIEATVVVSVRRPDKARVEYEVLGTAGVQAISGSTAWWHAPLSGISEPTDAPETVATSLRRSADLDGPLVGWREHGHDLTLTGRRDLDGRKVIELELLRATGERILYSLDEATLLVVQTREVDPGGEGTETVTFSNYREIDGLRMPLTIDSERPSGRQVTTFEGCRINVPLTDTIFERPAATAEPAADVRGDGVGGEVVTVAEIDAGTGGLEIDATGTLYHGDFGEQLGDPASAGTRVWKVSPDGEITLFADGLLGASGNAMDAAGNLLQASIRGNTIHRIAPDGSTTLVTDEGLASPVGLAVDEERRIYVANCGNGTIRRLHPDGSMLTFAESPLLVCPNGLAIGPDGDLFVSNFFNGDVLKIDIEGIVRRLATLPGHNNGHLTIVDGRLFVVARSAHRIYEVTQDGDATVVAGDGRQGATDGPALRASFNFPNDIVASRDGRTLYVNEIATHTADGTRLAPTRIRRITLPTD